MNTKQIPGLITLIAGLITCIISIVCQIEVVSFLKSMIWVIIIFYIIGGIIKLVLDKYVPMKDEEEEQEDGEEQQEDQEDEEKEQDKQNKAVKTEQKNKEKE